MDSELLEPSINGDPLLTAQDAEMDARGLHHAENSSDEGLLEPKKVSLFYFNYRHKDTPPVPNYVL